MSSDGEYEYDYSDDDGDDGDEYQIEEDGDSMDWAGTAESPADNPNAAPVLSGKSVAEASARVDSVPEST